MKSVPSFSLILPDIRSCHNVGAMFRTADACGVDRIYLVGYTPHPPRKEIDKVALGAEQWVPWEAKKDPVRLIRSLKSKGVQIVVLEKTPASVPIAAINIRRPVALIVGNEVDGVLPRIQAVADIVAHIPMRGKKESLNVSVAGGIAMYTVAEKLQALSVVE